MTTPRLFLNFETKDKTGKAKQKNKDDKPNSSGAESPKDDDSACILGESSQSIASMSKANDEIEDSGKFNCRYQVKKCETPFYPP